MNPDARRRTFHFLIVFALILCLVPDRFVSADDLPAEAYVSGVIGHPQNFNLSCESRSAADWAAFFGLSVQEDEILALLPRTDNPDTGFVGNPNGVWGNIPPQSYGVHAAPIAAALRKAGLEPARTRVGLSWNAARAEIAAGKPVIVWIIGQMWGSTPVRYTASDGKTTTVARFEHTMILVGYSPNWVHVIDAYTGWTQTYDLNSFLASWAVLGNMAVVYKGNLPGKPQPVSSSDGPGGSYIVQPGDYLASVAANLNVPWLELADLNHLTYPYWIYSGQELKLPGKKDATPPQPPPAQPSPTSQPPAPTTDPGLHTVQVGETLLNLAKQMGISWQELAEYNKLDYPYFIYPGQVIHIPPLGSAAAAAPAPTNTPLPPTATSTAAPQPPPATPTESAPSTYTVQRGDYLIDLARKFGVDWQGLVEINSIPYPYTIYPGQVLRLR